VQRRQNYCICRCRVGLVKKKKLTVPATMTIIVKNAHVPGIVAGIRIRIESGRKNAGWY